MWVCYNVNILLEWRNFFIADIKLTGIASIQKRAQNNPLTHKLTLSYTRAKLTAVYHTIHCYSLSVEIGVFFSIFLKGRKTKSKFSKKSSSSSSFTCYDCPPPSGVFPPPFLPVHSNGEAANTKKCEHHRRYYGATT